jgi:hypothetical protein
MIAGTGTSPQTETFGSDMPDTITTLTADHRRSPQITADHRRSPHRHDHVLGGLRHTNEQTHAHDPRLLVELL